jgi:hypothetical protein
MNDQVRLLIYKQKDTLNLSLSFFTFVFVLIEDHVHSVIELNHHLIVDNHVQVIRFVLIAFD